MTSRTRSTLLSRWRGLPARFQAILALTAALAIAVSIVAPVVTSTPAAAATSCGTACTNVSADPRALASELMQGANTGAFTEATITTGSIIRDEIARIADGTISAQCNIQTRVLQTLVIVQRNYGSLQVTDLNRWCANDGTHRCGVAGSSPWHCAQPAIAIDFGRVGGNYLDGGNPATISFLGFLNSFLPAGMHVGQVNCRSASLPSMGFANLSNEFSDTCNHLHIDFSSAGGSLNLNNPPAAHAPIGAFDSLTSPSAASISVSGWAYDSDTPGSSAQVEVWMDGTRIALLTANLPRADVNNAGYPGNRGFATTLTVNPGAHTVGLNVLDTSGVGKAGLGQKAVTVLGTVPAVSRLTGATRYDSAAAVSQAGFPATAPVVYIASGENAVDSAYAGAAAAKQGGPLLLTASSGLSTPTQSELARLKPARVVFVGGTTTIPDALLATARTILPGATVTRADGADRFSAARATIRSAFTTAPVVFVVNSNSWTDAIVAGNTAAYNGEPVMIVNGANSSVDPADATLLRDLKTTAVRVIGGSASVSDAMLNSFASLIPNTQRVAGGDRFDTAAVSASRTFRDGASAAYIVSGLNYPDGLTSSGYAGRSGGPMLLSRPECVPQATLAAIYQLRVSKVVLIGGTVSLTPDVASLKLCGV